MKRLHILTGILVYIISQCGLLFSKDITSLQLIFAAKQAFPALDEIYILISTDLFSQEEKGIARAAAQSRLKAKVHVIKHSSEIGGSVAKIPNKGVVIVFNSGVLSKKKSMLYVLSKCKARQIAIVTPSHDYAELGALLGVVRDEKQQVKVVLNLKHNVHLKSKFTADLIKKVGINEVIE